MHLDLDEVDVALCTVLELIEGYGVARGHAAAVIQERVAIACDILDAEEREMEVFH